MRKKIELFGLRMKAAVQSHPVEVSLSVLACAMGCYDYESEGSFFDMVLQYMPVVFLFVYTLNRCCARMRRRLLYYFSALIGRIVELDADNVGVVCKTDVLNKTPKTLAIREVLSNKFGVGNSVFRTGVDKVMKVDTVPFGCYRRDTFERFGMYDERLIRNQDFELNYRIRKGSGRIFIVPDSNCTYYARESFKKLWIQNYKNGLWGIRTVLFTGNSNSLALRHYIPMIFVLSLIVPLFASLLWGPFMGIGGLSLLAYLLMIGGVSFCIAIRKHLNILYLLLGFATLHLSNGCGMLVSLFTAKSYVRRINAQRQ